MNVLEFLRKYNFPISSLIWNKFPNSLENTNCCDYLDRASYDAASTWPLSAHDYTYTIDQKHFMHVYWTLSNV